MTKRAVDLGAVRKARAALKRLAANHPELRGRPGEANRRRWMATLEDDDMATKKAGAVSDEQLVVRLPKALLERVDAYAERLREQQPGPSWKRSDVVRLLLARALDAAEPKTQRKN
jgi:hypothetical protein